MYKNFIMTIPFTCHLLKMNQKNIFLHICYNGFKKLDLIFPLVEIVSVLPLAIIFNK
jgi:hypothetical protein